ncbi:hypothetical protein EBS80_04435, partial [bacterium]|nr:hypothetical protein [bacterium]
EGPFLEDHLLLMLQVLAAVRDEKLHLTDIEELARLGGYEGEVEEIEETLKENAALYETFALVHDAAKWALVYFDAPEGSGGRAHGFKEETWAHREDVGSAARANARSEYLRLFDAFVATHPGRSRRDVADAFYDEHRIEAHYAGHDRAIHAATYRGLLERVALRRQLAPRDVDLLETLIAHHLDPIHDFINHSPQTVLRYHALAAKHGYDADDFADLLQGCLFLDTVVGSRPNDAKILANFLRSEHDFAPWRRSEKERVREEKKARARNGIFRATGLDGIALMDLLGMEPGPAFGKALREIQTAIVAGEPLPKFGRAIDATLLERVQNYYQETLVKGA